MIRRMKAEDYDEVLALWQSCPGVGLNDVDDSREGIAKFLLRNPDTCFVAEQDDQIVGVILSGNDGRRGYIYHTAVSPACRGQGIATMLANRVMEAMASIGIQKVALVAFRTNEGGNAFWEHQGFTLREDLHYRNKYT